MSLCGWATADDTTGRMVDAVIRGNSRIWLIVVRHDVTGGHYWEMSNIESQFVRMNSCGPRGTWQMN